MVVPTATVSLAWRFQGKELIELAPAFPPMADRLDKVKFSKKRVPRSRGDGEISSRTEPM
jgi:hypothetical protein